MDKHIQEILSQKFTPFSEGLQAWAFESFDKKFVLKLFKDMEEAKNQWLKWGKDPSELHQSWIDNGFKSYKLAIEKIPKETALLYVHLNNEPVPIEKIVVGEKEFIASETHFLLQEKVELVCDRIKTFMQNGDIEGAKRVIDEIMEFIASLWKKGITEDTFNFDHNYGYTADGRLAQIDVGSFWEGREHICKNIKERKLLDSASSKWIEETFSELVEYYKNAAMKLYDDFKDYR
jgi:hypothetical protein